MNRDISRDDHRTSARDDGNATRTATIGCPSRRAVLLGVGGLGTAAALAACGANASGGGGGTAGNDSGGSGGQASNDLGATTAIPVGGGKIFPDQLVVVTQPEAGTFKAFSATCTHEGCTVNQLANGLIVCPCHGSAFSISNGAVKQGPAIRPLPEKQITIANGEITLV
ncbi:MAG TPA: Rieske (2Fe-2S) protein [Micromonosporaceae bacterium]|jgi:Rieske Fe-S protein|nr:Rieske (2Fe-2S) protein [Micromonosporaceae bacterium]